MENTATPTNTTTEPSHPPMPQAQPEHAWLQALIGEWTFETRTPAEPGKPSETFRGTEKMKAVGDIWIVGESEGDMPGGGKAKMVLTLGFDPTRDRFVGTWLGSMMTHLWVYEGRLDASRKVLTLDAEGPSFADPKKFAKYQDIIEILAPDHRTLRSRVQGEDGQWTQFMEAHYRRTT